MYTSDKVFLQQETTMKMMALILIGYLWSNFALATVQPDPPKPPPTSVLQEQGQKQAQGQHQSQGQSQRAEAVSTSQATAQTFTNNDTYNAGVNNNTHIVTRESAAALAQGSLYLGECGFGANGGGSGRGGAGFLGLTFQTPQCNDFKLASYYFMAGDYATGCAIIAATKAGKRQAKRGITLPQCKNPPPPVVAPPVVVNVEQPPVECPACPTCDKAFKQCVRK